MATDDSNPSGDNATPPVQTAPVQQHSQPAAQPDLSSLVTSINALPELIAKSVREAVAPAKNPPKVAEEKKTTEVTEEKKVTAPPAAKAPEGGTPGKKTFAQWWFGQ